MKINLAKSAGFCFGVKRAVDMAVAVADGKETVYMLKDIVHNEDVVRMLAERGIRRIDSLNPFEKGV